MYSVVQKALFQCDPEWSHDFTLNFLKRSQHNLLKHSYQQTLADKPVNCLGLTFKNPTPKDYERLDNLNFRDDGTGETEISKAQEDMSAAQKKQCRRIRLQLIASVGEAGRSCQRCSFLFASWRTGRPRDATSNSIAQSTEYGPVRPKAFALPWVWPTPLAAASRGCMVWHWQCCHL